MGSFRLSYMRLRGTRLMRACLSSGQGCRTCRAPDASRMSSRAKERLTSLIRESARSRARSRRDLCFSDCALVSRRHLSTRATRSATAPLLANMLSMRLALSLKASTARATAIGIRSGESSLVDAASIAARHRSVSVNATSTDEQSLGRGQRIPALGTTHQRLLNSPTCATTEQ